MKQFVYSNGDNNNFDCCVLTCNYIYLRFSQMADFNDRCFQFGKTWCESQCTELTTGNSVLKFNARLDSGSCSCRHVGIAEDCIEDYVKWNSFAACTGSSVTSAVMKY
jgi:hypothetical protein